MSTSLRKRKITYTVMIVSDAPAASHRKIHVRTGALAVVGFVLFVALICYAVYTTITMFGAKDRSGRQIEQIVQLKEANEQLLAENETLGNKVSSLEENLNQRQAQEHELLAAHEETYIPKGFPMSGAAQIREETVQTEGEEEDGNADDGDEEDGQDEAIELTANEDWKEVIFVAAPNTKVVATAPGIVKETRAAEGEISYVIIDHGNGYVTTYRNQGTPIVEEGSEVVKGVALFLVGEDNTETGYSIRKDDSYIDPMEMIEIKG